MEHEEEAGIIIFDVSIYVGSSLRTAHDIHFIFCSAVCYKPPWARSSLCSHLNLLVFDRSQSFSKLCVDV
jgi:hypothetical protein